MNNIFTTSCVICGKDIHPDRLAAGYTTCFTCADNQHDEKIPKALIHSTSKEGDFEVEVVSAKNFHHIRTYTDQ